MKHFNSNAKRILHKWKFVNDSTKRNKNKSRKKHRTQEGERSEKNNEVRCAGGGRFKDKRLQRRDDVQPWRGLKGGEVIHRDSPYGSILRPTGADGGRLGPSIIIGGDGAPPLTGEGPYESPVMIKPSVYKRKRKQLTTLNIYAKTRSSVQAPRQMYDHNKLFSCTCRILSDNSILFSKL